MNKYPEIKFQMSIALDIEMGFQFMETKAGGVDFGQGMVERYPQLLNARETSGVERRSLITNFTQKYYALHQAELENTLKRMEDGWRDVAKEYFKAVDGVFDKAQWPKGEYVCYLSIFNCNPRFLETKSFQVYYQHKDGSNFVIAHEMLHFIFFEYLHHQEGEFLKKLSQKDVWLLSELFNDLVLELPTFSKFAQKTKFNYPEVTEFAKSFPLIKPESFSIQSFLKAVKEMVLKI